MSKTTISDPFSPAQKCLQATKWVEQAARALTADDGADRRLRLVQKVVVGQLITEQIREKVADVRRAR